MNEKRKGIRDAFQKFKENPDLNKDELLKCLNSYKDKWKEERRRYEQVWRNNLAFYKGNHWVREASRSDSEYKVRLKENHVNNAVSRMVSIFVQNLPITRIFPSSFQEVDIKNAENSEAYAKYFWRTKKLEIMMGNFVKHTAIFGGSYMFHQWDPYAGGKILLDAHETKSGDQEVRQYRGDIKVRFADPFKVLPRPGIDSWDDMYDYIESEPASRAQFESIYGTIECDSAVGYNSVTNQVRQDDDQIIVDHYYHKPTPWFEEGLYVCWAGKTVLKAIEWPKDKGEPRLPGVYLPFDNAPMSFHGISNIEQVIDLQEQLNNAASMIVTARNLMARPRVYVSNESKIPMQMLSDQPGLVIRGAQAGGPPQFFTPSFNFTELANHKADVRNALEKVIGVTSASRGDIPAATRTALALQLVLEQDRSQYLPFIKRWHQSIQDFMHGILTDAAEFIGEEDPRTIKIEGQNTARTFHGGMVPSELDIYLEDTNPLGWTAAGRIEQIQNLITAGVLKDRNQVLDLLKINSPDPAFEEVRIGKEAASREIEILNKGQELEPMPEDNDPVHLDEHIKVVQSFEFRTKPPHVRQAHLKHIELHKARMQQSGAGAPPTVSGNANEALAGTQAIQEAPVPGQNMEQLITSSRAG